jgi:hypothetical protein
MLVRPGYLPRYLPGADAGLVTDDLYYDENYDCAYDEFEIISQNVIGRQNKSQGVVIVYDEEQQ